MKTIAKSLYVKQRWDIYNEDMSLFGYVWRSGASGFQWYKILKTEGLVQTVEIISTTYRKPNLKDLHYILLQNIK